MRVLKIIMACAILLSIWPVSPARATTIDRTAGPRTADRAPDSPALFAGTFRAIQLDGVDDYINVPDHPDLDPASEITIEAWVYRLDANRCETVVGKGYATSYWLGFCTNKLRFYAHGAGTNVDSNASVPAGRWTHIAVTYDGVTRRYYIDGSLDLTSTAANGPLAANSQPLGIGRDANAFSQNYFQGYLDEVRLWNVVRTQSEIQSNLYRTLSPQPGLVSVWRLDGDATDPIGLLNGTAQGGAQYSPFGVTPREVVIPLSNAAVTVNGSCSGAEYGGSERVVLDSAYRTTVYVHHSANDVYVCIEDAPRGSEPNTFMGVMVDRDNSKTNPAQPGDYRFTINFTGTTEAQAGTGLGGYAIFTPTVGAWQAATTNNEFTWSGEFRLARTLLNVPSSWDTTIGLDVAHFWLDFVGDDAHWPVDGGWNLPSTWANARFINTANTLPTYTLRGYVRDPNGVGLPGATVQLLASNAGATSLISTTQVSGGFYQFTYTGYSPDYFLVQEIDPRGMRSVGAYPGNEGTAVGPNLLSYPGSPITKTYPYGVFTDTLGLSTGDVFNRHYLIVHPPAISQWDLWPIIDMKEIEGYQIETISTQTISTTVSGRDLAEKIRNWLKQRWQLYSPDDVYALLVGRADVLPIRDVGSNGDDDHLVPGTPTYHPAWPTEWYYADLDSNWDTDNDGYYGEFLYCQPGRKYKTVNTSTQVDCPVDGSALREGPAGTWTAEISVGRLPLNTGPEVRNAAQAVAGTEANGSRAKRQTLLAGGMWSFEGRAWNADTSSYSGSWDGVKPFGDDTAEHLEGTLRPILAQHMAVITTAYEIVSPGNNPALFPTRFTANISSTSNTVPPLWQENIFGLINVESHGSPSGIATQHWRRDVNNNQQIEDPINPAECTSPTTCWEMSGFDNFFNTGMDYEWRSDAERPPKSVLFANACDTGAVAWIWDGVDDAGNIQNLRFGPEAMSSNFLGNRKAAAWIGSLGPVQVGGVDRMQDDFNRNLLAAPLRLGDAFWQAQADFSTRVPYDPRSHVLSLSGDPAHAYWGNPADSRAPWPQAGNGWRATGATLSNGPTVGSVAWVLTSTLPQSPPVVDRQGRILAAASGSVFAVQPSGSSPFKRTLGVTDTLPMVATTDGFYAAIGGTLYKFDRYLTVLDQISLGGLATGAPRVGPDGIVWVPTSLGMARMTGDGIPEILSGGAASGSVAFTPAGAAVWSTASVLRTYNLNRRGQVSTSSFTLSGTLTSPAIDANGYIYAGSSNGRLYRAGSWLYNTGAAISAKPVIGFNNNVYVGNAAGSLLAISPAGALVWSQSLGSPIVAAPAADASRLYVPAGNRLYALDQATGTILWSVPLGGNVDARSTPAIGANRTVYVTTSNGRLVAIAEGGWLTLPSEVAAQAGINSTIVSWIDNSLGETGFQIDRCTPAGSCTSAGTASSNAISITINGLTPGQFNLFRVKALGAIPGETVQSDTNHASEYAYSDAVSALPALPGAPTSPSAVARSAQSIQVNWSAGSGAQLLGYDLYRSVTTTAQYERIAQVGPGTLSYLDGDLLAGTQYVYTITARSETGSSSPAGPVNATTKAIGLPQPTNFNIGVSSRQMALTWQDNASTETGYVIERQVPGSSVYEPLALLPANSQAYTDTVELTEGLFGYRVKAVATTIESEYALRSARTQGFDERRVYLPLIMK
jgi:hypothetical protein